MSEEDVETAEPDAATMGGAGDQLRAERERQELTLAQIASKTRIPLRHLETMEAGEFANLPGRTYAVGFARTYAKELGLDAEAMASHVREELGAEDPSERYAAGDTLQPGDPARVPSRGLVFFSIAAIILLLAGGFMFYRTYFNPGAGPGSILSAEQAAEEAALQEATEQANAASANTIDPAGEVVFTALEDETWVKFYDSASNRLMEKQMAKGETYTIPADAENPQILTGRPYALSITIGGKEVPKLTEEAVTVADIPVSAEALLARTEEPAGEAASDN